MAFIRFLTELNGLQTGIKYFLGIGFSHILFMKILKSGAVLDGKVQCRLIFLLEYYDRKKCHRYSFVERVELNRLVYGCIFIGKEVSRRKS